MGKTEVVSTQKCIFLNFQSAYCNIAYCAQLTEESQNICARCLFCICKQ
uniref:Uncharacterized protein n=1 Tax=Anguilla anguilla TaxID=7936 RepID=A0A0E9TRK5_ANGAN